jgi:uncharacterized protein (TIGR02996 family)
MPTEADFLAAIAAEPDDDTHRLVFADWLDENGQPERAELIRVQVEFEPLREDFDSDRAAVLRKREEELLDHFRGPWHDALQALVGEHQRGIGIIHRRGLPERIVLPVQWFLQHAETLRTAYPTLTRLDLFRVNGWGQRLAECPHLEGIRELEIACWTSGGDVEALVLSHHLHRLRMLRVWIGENDEMNSVYRALRRSKVQPGLQEVQVLWGDPKRFKNHTGRPTIRCIDPWDRLYALAPGGGGYFDGFFPGKLPDGTQVLGRMPQAKSNQFQLLLFDRAGNQTGERIVELPPELVPQHGMYGGGEGGLDRWWAWERGVAAYLVSHLKHKPGMVRIKGLEFSGPWSQHIEDIPGNMEDELGVLDDPEQAPEDDGDLGEGGYGGSAYDWIEGRKFVFWNGNDWWVDGRTGDVEST